VLCNAVCSYIQFERLSEASSRSRSGRSARVDFSSMSKRSTLSNSSILLFISFHIHLVMFSSSSEIIASYPIVSYIVSCHVVYRDVIGCRASPGRALRETVKSRKHVLDILESTLLYLGRIPELAGRWMESLRTTRLGMPACGRFTRGWCAPQLFLVGMVALSLEFQ
jgi:hypothetical protein